MSEILSRMPRTAQRGMLHSWCYRVHVWSQPVQPRGGQKRSLTGKKLHSWVFGSYFSTTSIGDCWLPKPPITSRTSFAPRAKRESEVKLIPSQPKGHLKGITWRNTEPSLVQQAASKSLFWSLLWSRHLTWERHPGSLRPQREGRERNSSRVGGSRASSGVRTVCWGAVPPTGTLRRQAGKVRCWSWLDNIFFCILSTFFFFSKPLTTPWKLKEDGCFPAPSSQNRAFSPRLQMTSRPDGTFVHHFTEKQVKN